MITLAQATALAFIWSCVFARPRKAAIFTHPLALFWSPQTCSPASPQRFIFAVWLWQHTTIFMLDSCLRG